MKRIILWSSVILVIGISVFGMVKLASRSAPDTGQAITVDSINAKDWVKGNREAKVVLIEYSDFQCPACAYYYPLLKKLAEEFGDKIVIAYRHFPLPNHQNAKPAAYATEAAGRQGKFWEMHDLIFDNQKDWSDKRNAEETFVTYANSLRLDIEKFKNDFASPEIKDKVENDYQSGQKARVNATPTFFLNGKKIANPRNYDELRNIINQTINENS